MSREIEFVPEKHPDDEPVPAAQRRVPRSLLAALTVAALAAAAIWILTRPDAGSPTASPPQRTATVTVVPTPKPTPSPPPSLRTCVIGQPSNPQLRALVLKNLPGTKVLPALSYRCTLATGPDRKVVSESLAGRVGSLVIEVQASRRVGDSGLYQPTPPGRRLILLASTESQSAGLNVTVEAFGAPRTGVPDVAMSELAADISLGLVL